VTSASNPNEPLSGPDPIEELVRAIGQSPQDDLGVDSLTDGPGARRSHRRRRKSEVSPDQCRRARDILDWTRGDLAKAANVTLHVVANFENGRGVSPASEAAIRAALEAVGIGFPFEIANGRAQQAGVIYSPPDRKEGH
jgi:DNA-binding XRE family transcriptional regulator